MKKLICILAAFLAIFVYSTNRNGSLDDLVYSNLDGVYLDYEEEYYSSNDEIEFKLMKNGNESFNYEHNYYNCTYEIVEENNEYIAYKLSDFEDDFHMKIAVWDGTSKNNLELYGKVEDDKVIINEEDNSLDNLINNTYAWHDKFNIKGTLFWKDRYNNTHPLIGIKVELIDEDVFLDDSIVCYTDGYGRFTASFKESDWLSGADLKLRIYPTNDEITIKNEDNIPYVYETEVLYRNMDEIKYEIPIIVFDVEEHGQLAEAFQIGQPLVMFNTYAKKMSGEEEISHCNIIYPSENSNNCYYDKNGNIYITSLDRSVNRLQNYESWDLIMHEYAHHVQGHFNLLPDATGNHVFFMNCYSKLYMDDNLQGNKAIDKKNACEIAWREGLATALGIMAQQFYSDQIKGVKYAGDYSYDTYSYSYNYLQVPGQGEDCEGVIVQFLLNLYDEDDAFYIHDMVLWDLTINSGVKTFSEFLKVCDEYFKEDNKNLRIGELLTADYGGISVKIQKTDPYNISWNLLTLIYSELYTVYRNTFPYNRFIITILDENFNVLVEGETNNYYYEFNQYEVSKMSNSEGDTLNVIIYAFQDCTDGDYTYNTGPFISKVYNIKKTRLIPNEVK